VTPHQLPTSQTVTPRLPERLRFTGTGAGYFGIWIVNLLLTIVTLGVYSAWAKVRRLQYFYRNTELAGSSFDFHGTALRILVGRALALAMLILYNYSVRLHSRVTLLVIVLLAVVAPWLLRNSLRFRLYNSSWRGTRFHFRGSTAEAYRVFLLNGVLALITLYILAPFFHQRLKAWQHGNSFFGRTRFSFHASAGRFYLLYLGLLGLLLAIVLLFFLLGAGAALSPLLHAQPGVRVDPHVAIRVVVTLYVAMLLIGLLVGPTFHALITNLIWSNTRLGEHRIECHMSPFRLIWIVASNFVLVIVTLGLFIPWAMVRLARYHVESISVLPVGELQFEAAAQPEAPDAVGEEAASLFDFDIAL
jgi:uncharacterized membrane protein YjgN (DUF898 family)